MRALFSDWEAIAQRLAQARTIALFLDFDGTLARLQTRPETVLLQRDARRYLHQLAASPRFRIWVISGRRQADVVSRIRVPGIRYLGLHGWEGRLPDALPEATLLALASIKRQLKARFQTEHGNEEIWIEDKHAALAVHYRSTVVHAEVFDALKHFVEPFHDVLHIVRAKNVLEAVAQQIKDKGEAVRHQMSTIRNSTLPLYIGDDFIDEPAFRALPYGITVHVGRKRRTRARYWLPDVLQVHQLLKKLATEFA
jgi:trehalose 6-phosphate phosphatase